MEGFAVALRRHLLGDAHMLVVGIDPFGVGGREVERDVALALREPQRRAHRARRVGRDQDRALAGIDADRALDLRPALPERPFLEFDRLRVLAALQRDRAEHFVVGPRHVDAEAELEHDRIGVDRRVRHDRVHRRAVGRQRAAELRGVELREVRGQRLEPLAAALGVGPPLGLGNPHHDVGEHRRRLAEAAFGVADMLDVAAPVERRLEAEIAVAGPLFRDLRIAAVAPVPERVGIERVFDVDQGQREDAEVLPGFAVLLDRLLGLVLEEAEHRPEINR
ncbi:MAG: hypothetical protein U1F37_12785 [Alphaproteobacteria bacterium]